MLVHWYCPRHLSDYPQFFSFFLLYSSPQKLFPPFYLPAHWFVLLLIFSRVFLISVIVLFVSVCLFFNSSRSLLIDSYILSILFSRFLIIFTVVILNSFSGSLPISSSFTWTSLFLVCSVIFAVFLCLFFSFSKLLCLMSSSPGFKESWILSLKKVEFCLPFSLCPPKTGPAVSVSFL